MSLILTHNRPSPRRSPPTPARRRLTPTRISPDLLASTLLPVPPRGAAAFEPRAGRPQPQDPLLRPCSLLTHLPPNRARLTSSQRHLTRRSPTLQLLPRTSRSCTSPDCPTVGNHPGRSANGDRSPVRRVSHFPRRSRRWSHPTLRKPTLANQRRSRSHRGNPRNRPRHFRAEPARAPKQAKSRQAARGPASYAATPRRSPSSCSSSRRAAPPPASLLSAARSLNPGFQLVLRTKPRQTTSCSEPATSRPLGTCPRSGSPLARTGSPQGSSRQRSFTHGSPHIRHAPETSTASAPL